MKVYKILMYVIAFVFVMLLITGIFISLTFRQSVIGLLKKYTDEHLITEIEISGFDFSLFRKFPNATVVLHDVYAKSTLNFSANDFKNKNTDTLLIAESVFFEFDLLSIIHKKYKLKNIQFNNGKLNIYIDRQGLNNYSIWLTDKNRKKSDFNIDLKKFVFKNFSFELDNLNQETSLKCDINKIIASGNFSLSRYILSSKGELKIQYFQIKDSRAIQNRNLAFEFTFLIRENDYSVKNGIVQIDNVPLKLSGHINRRSNIFYDLNLSSNMVKLESLFSFFPETLNFQKNAKCNGYLKTSMKMKGHFGSRPLSVITGNFRLNKGYIKFKKQNIAIKNISMEGYYNSGIPELKILNFTGTTQESNFKGDYTVRNFKYPVHSLNVTGTFSLAEIIDLYKVPGIDIEKGFIKGNINIQGKTEEFFNIKKDEIINLYKNADMELENADIKLVRPEIQINEINGKVRIRSLNIAELASQGARTDNSTVVIDSTSYLIFDDKYFLKAELNNLFEYLVFKDVSVSIDCSISSDKVDLRKFSKKNDENRQAAFFISFFPDEINVNASFQAGTLVLNKFNCNNFSCRLKYYPSVISVENLSGDFMQGTLYSKLSLQKSGNNNIIFNSNSELQNINISGFFKSFNNFNQNYITSNHIKGYTTGDVILNFNMDSNFVINKKSVLSESKLTISDGELINFTPILGLSNYFKENELKHIKFQTFNSNISIKDETVYIPETYINSSLLNITGYGYHTFDNKYSYYLQVKMSDILFRKFKQRRHKEKEWIIQEDNTNKGFIPLIVEGNGENVKVQADKKQIFKNFKVRLGEEKQTFRDIFKDSTESDLNPDMHFEHDSVNLNQSVKNRDKTIKKNNKTYSDDKEEMPVFKWDD